MAKIGIAWTKKGYNAEIVNKAFKDGLASHGDTCIDIRFFNDLKFIKDCDAVFCVGYPDLVPYGFKFSNEPQIVRPQYYSIVNSFRIEVFKECFNKKKRILFLDSGVIGFNRIQRADENFYQIGWDNIKGIGVYFNKNKPDDRWKMLGRELKDWRDGGSYVLIFGQVRYGVGSQHIDIHTWYKQAIDSVLNTDKDLQVALRLHPNSREPPFATKDHLRYKFIRDNPFEEDISKALYTISFSSHSLVESILSGVPSVCNSELSMGYPLFHVSDIAYSMKKYKEMPSREETLQWLYNLCYTQWSVTEIRNGIAWNHLKQGLENKC